MLALNHTKGFFFNNAVYQADDGAGDMVLLKVDYKNNKFEIEGLTNKIHKNFRIEMEKFAQDMLARKHGTNFAGSR